MQRSCPSVHVPSSLRHITPEDVHRVLRRFGVLKLLNSAKVALSRLNSSSVGRDLASFQRTKFAPERALKATVDKHYESFAASLAHHATLLHLSLLRKTRCRMPRSHPSRFVRQWVASAQISSSCGVATMHWVLTRSIVFKPYQINSRA
ncbi:hypothetical protein CALVIDRAFT_361980 [Calocera viscosa TUFC12733]|uniref:Exocyst complex component Sec8 N-terminal domain-containing protein n=1 Tax=Calocera viscosa (strain TUFC12733) TaxID=1330018 RepID=A0A167H823_CALVF|nr:hypothetical protein CALVIDRAFT_361980 [Calocera viscosa TUFC12733]